MLKEFSAKNFRRFSDLVVEPLERVNLFAGKNSVGKTALLEAIFLSHGPGNPQLPTRIDRLRGLSLPPDRTWRWLFRNGQPENEISLESVDSKGVRRSLRLHLGEGSSIPSQLADAPRGNDEQDDQSALMMPPSLTTAIASTNLVLNYSDSEGQETKAQIEVVGDAVGIMTPQPPLELPTTIFLTARSGISGEDVERFSNVELQRKHRQIVQTLKYIEPRLKSLSVVSVGGLPMIYGDVGVGELVPIQLLGGGIVRLLSLTAAIANAPGGAVLVDEIENGLHHSAMVKVWRAVGAAARRFNTQVFATTHSRECIEAAHRAFSDTPKYDFRLHRLESVKGDIRAVSYAKESLEAALLSELAVR